MLPPMKCVEPSLLGSPTPSLMRRTRCCTVVAPADGSSWRSKEARQVFRRPSPWPRRSASPRVNGG
eukprot:107564-Pyramimonas_sp.AAC.1